MPVRVCQRMQMVLGDGGGLRVEGGSEMGGGDVGRGERACDQYLENLFQIF